MNAHKRLEILTRLKKNNPNPTTELHYTSHFELLVSVILSAQATDVSVNKATTPLFQVANTPEKMVQLGLKELKKYIKSIGLFNTKANNLIKTSKILIDKHASTVPQTRVELESLPGVGRKTANVILNTAFGHPEIAVDTHIFRVANRTKFAPGSTVLAVEKKLVKTVPDAFKYGAHHWFILHGRYTCTARNPRCKTCVIGDLCEYIPKFGLTRGAK